MPLFHGRGFAADVRAAERAIVRFVGVDPHPWFRMPFGSGADQPLLLARLAALGYRNVGWHVTGDDWHRRRSGRGVADSVVAGAVAHGDGAVVLLHTWPDATAAAMPSMVQRLRAAGAELVRVDQLEAEPGLTPVGEPRP
jgi:peptidoglycan/xylan/chitin deacetylase (PgdA/CDA1 family)